MSDPLEPRGPAGRPAGVHPPAPAGAVPRSTCWAHLLFYAPSPYVPPPPPPPPPPPGSIGFIGLNETFDLNIVIRTAVLDGGRVCIGAGGAVVVQSDPEGEFQEMRLKAAALLRAVGACDGHGGSGGSSAAESAEVDES